MAKKETLSCPDGVPEWMPTYADLMTLIMCFFVLLFSMSSLDAVKMAEVSKAMSSVFEINVGGSAGQSISIQTLTGNGMMQLPNEGTGVQRTVSKEQEDSEALLRKMASDFKTYFAENNVAEQVNVEVTEDYIELTFDNKLLFDVGRADLKPESISVLDIIANELVKYPNNDIKIEGHTDNLPINTERYPSNWELSAARAISVARYYVDAHGFSPFRISTEGFGEYRPEFPNDTAENRAKNRRVLIKIMGEYNSAQIS